MAVARLARMRCIFYNILYTIIRWCNARNKYNVVTTLFTDVIWSNVGVNTRLEVEVQNLGGGLCGVGVFGGQRVDHDGGR